MLLIGDTHGKIDEYHSIIKKYNGKTVQLGDFGFKEEHEWHIKNVDGNNHKVLFGNHDDPSYINANHSLGDYYVCDKFMAVRGAKSVDQWNRTEGVDWWPEEELTYAKFKQIIDVYAEVKPRVMLSHDCPQIVRNTLFGISDKTTTSNALQAMLEVHQPDLWVFGHHHRSESKEIKGTLFVCLNELETLILWKNK